MQRRSVQARVVLGAAALALVGGAIAPVGATAAGPTTGVTVFLKAPDLEALDVLAHARGLTHAQRVAALTKLLPSPAEHAQAVKALTAAGMTVTHQTAWSVSAAASSSTVSARFGTRPAMSAHATPALRQAAAGPYPTMPTGLGSVATAAFPTDSGPAVFRPDNVACGCNDGTDFRNAYTSPAQTAQGQPPYSGQDAAASLTIATIQLAGWNPSDLTQWSQTPGIGVSGFDAATSLTPVPVDLSAVPAPSTTDDGDVEVDLDQEALLSTDPYAHQRPYFAPNTNAGYSDAFSQVLDDVMQDSHAYLGGDKHIVALSVSWGLCEADNGNAFINSFEPILTSLLAAGVTVFASTGDDGIYDDCQSTSADVDYPASSPQVVAVGATNLTPVGASAPNNGSNWLESAWSCTNSSSCLSSGGSGGGASPTFSKPSYQNVITTSPYQQSSSRLVPDISANGDPATGFPVYSTDPEDTTPSERLMVVGGTSLAAPESAALFTNLLAAHGATTGVGDIHSALYAAYAADDGAFRDITVGSNGAVGTQPGDPSVQAAAGFDTVSGLGAPLWPAIASFIFEPATPPSATASFTLTHPHSSTGPRALKASWSGQASAGGAPVQRVSVTITESGHAAPVYTNASAPATGSYSFKGDPGATYIVSVKAFDLADDASDAVTKMVSVPIDDRQFSRTGPWKRVKHHDDIAGSAIETSHRDATATVTATGQAYAVAVRTGPKFGKLRISKGFTTIKTINLHAAHSGRKIVTFFSDDAAPASRTFRFTCLGKTVGIDGLGVAY